MGTVEFDKGKLIIHSHIITYGNAADAILTGNICEEIQSMWNEPEVVIGTQTQRYPVMFSITASFEPKTTPLVIYQNVDPRNNYFRIEEYAHGNISFVDGIGCNTGYFKKENLYKGSTTAAHEYGHTLGLDHPLHLDIRGKGVPGIMYPRGTLVDALFQYDPNQIPGAKGGTLNPIYRKVKPQDIELLDLKKLLFENNRSVIGAFSSIWHEAHKPV